MNHPPGSWPQLPLADAVPDEDHCWAEEGALGCFTSLQPHAILLPQQGLQGWGDTCAGNRGGRAARGGCGQGGDGGGEL